MIIEIKDLVVKLKEREILKKINLEVEEGQSFVILGPSGSGKTVLLKSMVGLIKPDSGTLKVLGYDMSNISVKDLFDLRKKTGMVFQNSALFDSMTVMENVGFSLIEHLKLPEEEVRKQVQQALSAVGLTDVLDKMPEELSGGMRKRVGIARALVFKPRIIFYDEPTAGLDVITSASIVNLMGKIHKEFNTTDVIVTHDLNIGSKLADKIAIIYNGEILGTGKWEELLESKNEFIRHFLNAGESI
ncbi:MAG: ATP-binding cassette domain-containing protein [Candidatus Omnitrophica bacterium]|nr:ATP-binding cassette domain-containing protein [Candidatus Omnitrophota bacterium]